MPFSVEEPVAFYAALAAGLCACLSLFVSLAGAMGKLRRRFERRWEESQAECGRVNSRVDAVEARLPEWEERLLRLEYTTAGLAAVRRQAVQCGIDANQRSRVLMMARRGERPEEIAAELRVPRNEVDLLIKVQRAVARAVG